MDVLVMPVLDFWDQRRNVLGCSDRGNSYRPRKWRSADPSLRDRALTLSVCLQDRRGVRALKKVTVLFTCGNAHSPMTLIKILGDVFALNGLSGCKPTARPLRPSSLA